MKIPVTHQNKLSYFILSSLAILFALYYLNSCTVLGYFIGRSIKEKGEFSGWQIESINEGRRIKVVLNNGDSIIGKFEGTELSTLERYADLYFKAKQQLEDTLYLPDLGEELSVSTNNDSSNAEFKDVHYYFEGFGYNTIYVRNKNNAYQHLSLLHDSKLILKDGSALNKGLVFTKLRENQIPTRNYILIKDNSGKINKINPMELKGLITLLDRHHYGGMGALIGAIADGVIVIVVINNALDQLGENLSENFKWGSCPLVYSYTGTGYKLDSEPFGGSIYQKAQRTDVDKLDYLQADKGYYRFKLANELEETQFVDEFKLIVVDHPLNYTLVPAFNGQIHAFSNMTAPVAAMDQSGNDVLALVKSKDKTFWVSYPFMRSPEVDGDERDALILEFDIPTGVEEVKLAFNVQNTIWGSYLQKEIVSMQGSNIQAWYDYMNKTPEARTAFTNAMIREGMLLIKEWTGSEWVARDYIWEVGPATPKDQAVVIKINPNDSQKLRLKLESTVGLWMVNSVFADYDKAPTFKITELSPNEAINQEGKSVINFLAKDDGVYYEMPYTTDHAMIKIKALPDPEKGIKRSYFLKCGGYYHIHVNNSIEPNQELIKELTAKPGAYGKFTLRQLNDKLSAVIE